MERRSHDEDCRSSFRKSRPYVGDCTAKGVPPRPNQADKSASRPKARTGVPPGGIRRDSNDRS